jgi:hypothetical protein
LHYQEIPSELLEKAPHDQFVDTCRQKECDECGCVFVDLERGDGGVEDVAEEEDMNGTVPVTGELVPGDL